MSKRSTGTRTPTTTRSQQSEGADPDAAYARAYYERTKKTLDERTQAQPDEPVWVQLKGHTNTR
jgi:hypothetical protein